MGLRRADDKGTFTGKLALRARVRRWLSAEAGLGAADDSDGKSLGGDRGSTWDAYGALRAAGSVAVTNQNVNGKPGAQDAAFALASAGATARVSDAIRLRFRGRRRPDGSPEHPRLRHRHPLWRRPSSSIFIEDFQVRLTLRPTTC